jgi:hypothetical protein
LFVGNNQSICELEFTVSAFVAKFVTNSTIK